MGYCMQQLDWHVKIASADKAGALAAIKAMPESSRWSWVSSNEVLSAETLEEALKAWRWEAVAAKKGNINYLHFMGEKYGEDPMLLKAIAPFMEDGAFIEMQGEDGERWMWKFSGGRLETFQGQTVYE